MKKFLNEFKEFALRGNVIDLAVGVIIGGAFQTIVKSLVDDLFMPFIGLATGGINFTDQFVILKYPEVLPEGVTAADLITLTAAKDAGATVFAYGSFITAVLNFVIMTIVIFLFIKLINNLHKIGKKADEVQIEAPTTKICPFCKSEIAIEATRCAHCTSELKE
ncbi:MAG: large conductance mechanosensitive channel protein MscL [Clostridia bacterium]|nr:large conductance mechanosensitive channel protein MscL [Clostridia bacterium]